MNNSSPASSKRGSERRHVGVLLRRWTLLIFGAIVLGVGLLWALQERMIYPSTREVSTSPRELGLDFEDVEITTPDGERLHGWWIPPAGPARGVVLYCHGNGGNVANVMGLLPALHARDLAVLAFDYRGYGRSTGRPNEAGTYVDAAAAHDYLVTQRGVAPDRVLLWGRSLGGAIVLHLAVDLSARDAAERPAGLVLESTFSSLPDVAAGHFPVLPVRWLIRPQYRSIDRIGDLKVPLIQAHAEEDEIVPYALGRALHEAAPEPKRFVTVAGGHNVSSLAAQGTAGELDAFLDEVLPAQSP